MIRRAEVQDHPWIVATGAEAYADLGDYTRILPSWLEQPGVLAWIDHDVQGRGRGFAMLGFYTEDIPRPSSATSTGTFTDADADAPRGPNGKRQQVVADLLALAVLPAYQRKGIGSKLLEHVIDVAERVAPASHISQLRLTVAENNTGAQRLYARTGFRIVEGAATYDRGQRALRMVRPLKSRSR
ncbi:MAG: GNAT family N-acetyltransferase [Kofleriaceae bacterium]|nr:GNAT family N-acetyltransferase [Kofleriaceae bacterium]